jgi:glucose/arabinose dehydrogenase
VTSRRRLPTALVGLTLIATTLLGGCALGAPPPDQNGQPPTFPSPSAVPTPSSSGDASDATVLATGLPQPWGIAFLPDGSALVTERKTGRIVKIGQPQTDDGLTTSAFAQVTGLSAVGDGGLLGIAVSPHYATDQKIYVYYSTTTDNRIVSLTNGAHPVVLVKGIPHGATDNGGGLAFGPDGYLYASTGDAGHHTGGAKAPSQSATSLGGKILRMTTAGKPAPGNPIATSLVYASGFHDVEGLAWDQNKHLYVIDAGTSTDDLLVVLPGRNYGWPVAATSGTPQPIQTFPAASSGCSGIAALDDSVVMACLTGKQLLLTEVNPNGTSFGAPAAALTNTYGRLRAVVAASDGTLWISTSNTDGHGAPGPHDDQIIRVVLADQGAGVT